MLFSNLYLVNHFNTTHIIYSVDTQTVDTLSVNISTKFARISQLFTNQACTPAHSYEVHNIILNDSTIYYVLHRRKFEYLLLPSGSLNFTQTMKYRMIHDKCLVKISSNPEVT